MRLVRLPRRPCLYSSRRVCRHVGSCEKYPSLGEQWPSVLWWAQDILSITASSSHPTHPRAGPGRGTGLFLTKLRPGPVIHMALSPHPLQTSLTRPHHSAQATSSQHSHIPLVWYLKRVPAPRKGDRWSFHPSGGRGWGACPNLPCKPSVTFSCQHGVHRAWSQGTVSVPSPHPLSHDITPTCPWVTPIPLNTRSVHGCSANKGIHMTATGARPPKQPSFWQPAGWRESGQPCKGPSKMESVPRAEAFGKRCIREKHLTWESNISETTSTVSSCRKGKRSVIELTGRMSPGQQGGPGVACAPSLTHHHSSSVSAVVQKAQGLLDGIHMLPGPGDRAGLASGCGEAADHSAQEKQVLQPHPLEDFSLSL